MIASLSPGLIVVLGALLVPSLPLRLRQAYMLALPLVAGLQLFTLETGSAGAFTFLGYDIVLLRVDGLSRVFGCVFLIAIFCNVVYALHEDDKIQQTTGLIYAGAAIGAVFVGDLISLFVFWELTAIASVFLIWASRTERAFRAGMRYLVIQVGSGVILLAGVILYERETGSVAFGHIGLSTLPTYLILFAIGIKCAFPFLHSWLQDAYPEATVTGTVVLSAFTTKLAVYALARGFAGTEILVYIGVIMTAFPVFFAVIENDLRRVLAFSLNNQLGFMVAGIGVGTAIALNGAVAHAFVHIIYKGLLFMSMGAVLHRVGTIRASELGGLYKCMPYTTIFCIIGAASISAVPLFSGFIAKALTLSGLAQEGYFISWLVLVFASAGVLHHSGIKIPYFAFFAHDSGKRCEEAPFNMLVAMAILSAFCIGVGVFPGLLYQYLPYEVSYEPYTFDHVLTQLQLVFFAVLAFSLLVRYGFYPPELRSTNLNIDWIYRRALPVVIDRLVCFFKPLDRGMRHVFLTAVGDFVGLIKVYMGPEGLWARTWPTGSTVLWVAVLLGSYLFLSFL